MIRVIWQSLNADFDPIESRVGSIADFLNSLKAVDIITFEAEEYYIAETEMVIDVEPYIVVNVTHAK